MKVSKAESHQPESDFENDLITSSALAKEYSTDLDRKSKNNTIEDRDLGTIESSTNNIIVLVRKRPLTK